MAIPVVAQTAGPEAVEADKDGWWNRLQGAESGTPLAPIAGVNPGVPQTATNIPPGSIGVSARLGEVDKVAAVGILVDALPGATVSEFTMTLKEVPAPGSNQNAASAVIIACPITAFWADVENGRWNGRPEANCDLGATQGERQPDGTWTFDLKAYGQALLDPFGTLNQNGVLLVPGEGTVPTFQVAWEGIEQSGPTFTFAATGGEEEEDPFATGGDTGGGGGSDFSGGDTTFTPGETTFIPGETTFSGGSSGGTDLSGDVAAPAPEPLPIDDGGGGEAEPVASTRGAQIGNLFGNLPLGVVLAAVLLVALLLVAGYVLGPVGRPTESLRRQGGVSRALAARRRPAPTATTLMETS